MGGNGYAWTGVASIYTSMSEANAYYLRFEPTIWSGPRYNYLRGQGFPIRCLAY